MPVCQTNQSMQCWIRILHYMYPATPVQQSSHSLSAFRQAICVIVIVTFLGWLADNDVYYEYCIAT